MILVFMVSLSPSLGYTLSRFCTFANVLHLAIYSLVCQFTLHPSLLYLMGFTYFGYSSSLL